MPDLTRRALLLSTPFFAAPEALRVKSGCQTNAWRINPANFDEVVAVVEKLKSYAYQGYESGYRNFESQFANPAPARARLERSGLEFLGIHIFMLAYDPGTSVAPWDLITKVAAGGASLGARRLILSGAPTSAAATARKAEGLNRAGEFCRQHGLSLAYHNHDKEFLNSGKEIEALTSQTKPDLVSFLVDAGHAFRALRASGKSATEASAAIGAFLTAHHNRIAGMHLRDIKNDDQVILGQGEFDLQPLVAAIRKTGWSGWVINEEERLNDVKPGDSAVQPARAQLRKIFGV